MSQRGGGCCIARYAGGAYDYNRSRVDKIMLMRFRPIAPKPAANGSFSSSASTENSETSPKSTTGRGRGNKRRHAAAKGHHNTTNKRSCGSSRRTKASKEDTCSTISVSKPVKTLSLLPETPELKKGSMRGLKEGFGSCPSWLSFADGGHVSSWSVHGGLGHVTTQLESWVRVERVTETWPWGMSISGHHDVDNGLLYGLGFTDTERVMSLDRDTCPGFVSDGENCVRWVNPAYRRMVAGGVVEREVAARLVVEDGVGRLPVGCAAFTCRVRVVVATAEKEKGCCKTVPCDAWRMDCGGFAWRLDTAAALSLGR